MANIKREYTFDSQPKLKNLIPTEGMEARK
jgi:hypothetical protein